jgi:hypothetical protein
MHIRTLFVATWLGTTLIGTSACTGSLDAGVGRRQRGTEPGVDPQTGVTLAEDEAPATSFPRLTHAQWETSARAALLLDTPTGLAFDPEASTARFDTYVGSREVTPTLASRYRDHADVLALRVTGDAALRVRLFEGVAGETTEQRLRGGIQRFLVRAFRRPLTTEELDRYVALAGMAPELDGDEARLREGMRIVISTALQSPHFLYRVERGDPATRVRSGSVTRTTLTDWELASRWSYTLLNEPPDAALIAEVERGALQTAAGRTAVVDRLLTDERATATLLRFHRALYGVDGFRNIVKSQERFPDTLWLASDAEQESTRFLSYVIESEGGVRALLTDRSGFVNPRLSRLYGMAADGTDESVFRQVEMPVSRGGILTRVGFNASRSDQVERNIIQRGIFILRNVLCEDPGPPASGNFAAAAGRVPPENATHRETIAFKTQWGACASCHEERINPLGFAFEGFDAIGREITMEGARPVDTRAVAFFAGERRSVEDASDLMTLIAERPSAHACYARSALEFLLGGIPQGEEMNLANRVGQRSIESDLSVNEIFRDILVSETYRTLRTPGGAS